MALTKKMVLTNNFGENSEFENAYIQVNHVSGTKTTMLASVFILNKKDGKILERREISFSPSVENESENFIKQAYMKLKQMPEYVDARDC